MASGRLMAVSSLYGPGTIACWYLTASSVLVSWTLHPQKRKSGSIDANLIATLTPPAVAAGHVISQSSGSTRQRQLFEIQDLQTIQAVAAIEAPLVVVETFMALSVILFLIAAWMVNIRRAIIVAVIGLLCFAVECHVYLSGVVSNLRDRAKSEATDYPPFTRPFVADFTALIVAMVITLSLVIVYSIGMIGILIISLPKKPFSSRRDSGRMQQTHEIPMATIWPDHRDTPTRATNPQEHDMDDTQVNSLQSLQRLEKDSLQTSEKEYRAIRAITMVSVLFMPLSFVASISPTAWHSIQQHDGGMSFWGALKGFVTDFLRDFFPGSNCSIGDLDQAVAAAAGATILAFSIYSVAKAFQKSLKARSEANLE